METIRLEIAGPVARLTLDEQRQSSGAAARETQESADVSIEARRERGSR